MVVDVVVIRYPIFAVQQCGTACVCFLCINLSNTVGHNNEVFIMKKLDFNNSLYYLLMDHAGIANETDGQRLKGCSVDQMFDDLLRDQEQPEPLVFTDNYSKRGNRDDN